MGIEYRPEIDGLRAIAVLAVVLFHAGIGHAGYVGVDIFFVISGYLITLLLYRDWRETGSIDLVAFYARRVRRIAPAASVMVVAVLMVSQQLLWADPQAFTAKSAGATLLFVANVFFQANTGGYFDASSAEMPLLHMWSLSVEEQVYLAWPALLMLVLGRRPRLLRPLIAALALVSLVLAEYWISQGGDAAFYQMPARFWELAAGGAIAVAPTKRLPSWLGWAGVLGAIAVCMVSFDHFPGLGALPAVASAGLVLASVHGGTPNALLRNRAMVAVGLVSYSLYLWHWPLLAFYRATSVGDTPVSTRLMLCSIAFVLAVASYALIEQPFRRRRFSDGVTVKAGVYATAILATTAFAMGWNADNGGVPDNPVALRAGRDAPSRACHNWSLAPITFLCPITSRTIVWGDSMGLAWMPAFPGASEATRDACAPILGYLRPSPRPMDVKCLEHNAAVAKLDVDTVILVAWWPGYPNIDISPTLDVLKDKNVLVVGPTPMLRDTVSRCVRRHAESSCSIPRAEFDQIAKPILARLRKASEGRSNVVVLDVTEYFCTATECPVLKEGMPLYWDSHHVSKSASSAFPHWAAARGITLPAQAPTPARGKRTEA
jgi:peptidoglycan/LPS O-acetylase OafA/YrhL